MSTNEPTVSVILVNFRGASDTITALASLREMGGGASFEVIVVDNDSGGLDVRSIREAHPWATVVANPSNDGFAGGCNRGVRAASGEIVAFLNNDARPDANWLSSAVERFADPTIGAVASQVLDWEGATVDYVGSALTWFGMGYKPFVGHPIPDDAEIAKDVLFGTGSGMFVRREFFEQLGGFDERFFMFFEDVDFGWRLTLAGHRFVYEPRSKVFHKHHASMSSFGDHQEIYLLERNALMTLFKNLGDERLADALPAALLLAVRRSLSRDTIDPRAFDIARGADTEPVLDVAKTALAGIVSIDAFVDELPALRDDRARIQANRVVSDAELAPLFGRTDAPSFPGRRYLHGYESIVRTFDVAEPEQRRRVLIITGDPIGVKMAGPAIRATAIAEAAAASHEVVVVSLSSYDGTPFPYDVVVVSPADQRCFARWEQWADVIVFQGLALRLFPALADTKAYLVADVYDPMHLEQLEQARSESAHEWRLAVSSATDVMNEQLQRADFLICASEAQRVLYLGQLAALGRINTATYAADGNLRRLVDVVPFGLPAVEPERTGPGMRQSVEGITSEDRVLIWSGGLYDWFDPQTLITAVALLSKRRDNVRLFFQGTQHPHPGVPLMKVVAESRALAKELGVLDRAVFFNDAWVPYGDRQNYLLDADAGVSTHHLHVETEFSFRTRILDYLWAGLPMVVTEGDHFADLVAREELGIVVPAGDVEALAVALDRILFDEALRRDAVRNIARVRELYRWGYTLAPLVAYLAQPHRAADRIGAGATAERPRRRKLYGPAHDARRVAHYLRHGGLRVVIAKVKTRI
ncbi:MAG: glycosyltransferase, partial [Microbacteriaceae bacterium]|nr:glycosyltransferase [Microbacteriaceae bacterium]